MMKPTTVSTKKILDDIDDDAGANTLYDKDVPIIEYSQEVRIVPEHLRKSPARLSQYEMTEIVGIRASQIEKTGHCLVDITGLDNEIDMAKRELLMRKCPLLLRREVGRTIEDDPDAPGGKKVVIHVEVFDVNAMELSHRFD